MTPNNQDQDQSRPYGAPAAGTQNPKAADNKIAGADVNNKAKNASQVEEDDASEDDADAE